MFVNRYSFITFSGVSGYRLILNFEVFAFFLWRVFWLIFGEFFWGLVRGFGWVWRGEG